MNSREDAANAATDGASEARYFFCRLLPPRPTFVLDMTDAERTIMETHAAYWAGYAERGVAVIFGPVADPAGPWGLGIVRATNEAEVASLQANDPAIAAGIGMRYETLPLLRAIVGR